MPSNHPCFSSLYILVQLFLFLLLLPDDQTQTLIIGLAEISFEELLVLRKCLLNYWFFATAATKFCCIFAISGNQWEGRKTDCEVLIGRDQSR